MNLASLGDMRNGLLGGASAAMASSSERGMEGWRKGGKEGIVYEQVVWR